MLQAFRESFEPLKIFFETPEQGRDAIVSLQAFQSFLVTEQCDPIGDDERKVSQFMRDYLQDQERDVQEPYFKVSEVSAMYYS